MSTTFQAEVRTGGHLDLRASMSTWCRYAWIAIGITAAFVGLTCWWLTQDHSIPIDDAGYHLETAIVFHRLLQAGNLLEPFRQSWLVYPPLAPLVGALGMFIGGVNVSSPIIAENVVFVPLLSLGCYQTGRLLFGARAGMLAVLFVLGSPLLIAQLHVFMLDAPETAVVAVSLWLILASEQFSRVRIAQVAGLVVGCGLLIKAQFPFFIIGAVVTALFRGGWRNRRGLLWFAAVAIAISVPWYIGHFSELRANIDLAGVSMGDIPGNTPPTLSVASLMWYLWSTLNSQLLAPLFILTLGGAIWTIAAVARRRPSRGPRLEFLVGGVVAWLAITLTRHHDIRYDMPLMPYLAVIGTGWIMYLPRALRLVATGVVVLAVAANTIGTTFGLGGQVQIPLVGSLPAGEALPDRVVLYSNSGFLVAGPKRDGDVPGLIQALGGNGIQVVAFSLSQSAQPDFSNEGLVPLAMIAHLKWSTQPALVRRNLAAVALVHLPISPGAPPTCTRLSDGTGVWVLRLNPASGDVGLYCPFRRPRFYGASVEAQNWAGMGTSRSR